MNKSWSLSTKLLKFKLLKIRKLKLIFLCFLVIQASVPLTLVSKVKADSFYSSGGDVDNCSFASTVGVQYNSIGGNGVSWNASDVEGNSGSWIQSHSMLDVADISYPDAHKYPGVGDYVAVPPNTHVEFGMWVWNYSGHNVDVDSIHFFTSRSDPSLGDLTRVGAGGSYASTSMPGFGTRSGKRITTGSIGTFNHRTAHGGRIFYSFDTIQPIQLVSFTATPTWSGSSLVVRYDVTLRNVSAYNLGNIRVRDVMPSGAVYDQTHTINSGQTRTFSYTENWGTSYPENIVNDGVTIYDNNRHVETQSATQPSISNYSNPEVRPAVAMRDDSNAPSGWNSGQPTWGQINRPPITVELIPYNFSTNQVSVNASPDLRVTKVVTDSDEIEVKSNEVRNQEEFLYTIRVENLGGTADNIVVVDDYDQDQIDILDADSGVNDGDTLYWDFPVLNHGDILEFRVRAQVKDLPHGTYTIPNSVTVTSDQSPPVEDSTTTNATAEVIMSIEKTVTDSDETNVEANDIHGSLPEPNQRLMTYTINIENSGDADAHNVRIVDDISELNQYGEIQNISDNGQILQANPDQIVWDIGTLAKQTSRTVTFEVQLSEGIEDETVINNNAEVQTEEAETLNDSTITTVHIPMLELEKVQDLPETVTPGQPIIYTLNFRNIGSASSPYTKIVDTIPEHTTFVDFVTTDSDIPVVYDPESRTVTWEFDNLASREEGEVSFKVVIDIPTQTGTEIRNRAILDSPSAIEVSSEVVTSVASSCCMTGTVWDDANKNGKFDFDENPIENAKVTITWAESEFLPENNSIVFTNENGIYTELGLPYNTLLTIKVDIPAGFDNATTPTEYKVILLPLQENGVHENYVKDGIHYITADGCMDFLNAGIYRDILIADTGDSVVPVLTISTALLGTGIVGIILSIKRKKKNK